MKNLWKWIGTAGCVVLLMAVWAESAHFHGSPIVRNDIGTAVGQIGGKLPDFTLPDLAGKSVTLSQFYGKGPILLTFDRSLDW